MSKRGEKKSSSVKAFMLGASAALLGLGAYGLAVTIPHSFAAGTTISSAQVNANFQALKNAVDKALMSKNGRYGYAWYNQPATASYTITNQYTFNSAGGAITGARASAGVYSVTFNGLGISGQEGGNVQVTSYGGGANFCKVAAWDSMTGGNFTVTVNCYDHAGAPVDTQFTIQASW